MIIKTIIVMLTCFTFLIVLRNLSIRLDLVDKPDHRKTHIHHIPLVGGIGIYLSIIVMSLLFSEQIPHIKAYLISGAFLLIVGVLDDRFDLPVMPRIIIHTTAALIIMTDGVYLHSLGLLWFGHELTLGFTGYILTLVAVGAAINIFNMVDGIDGLLAGLCTVSIGGLAICFSLAGEQNMMAYCLYLIAALVPFVLLNMGFPFGLRQKIFMGDAGSTLLGFTVIWLVMMSSQGKNTALAPANALWLLALPLMDMVGVASHRIRENKSIFRPDRSHLHHLLMACGLSAHQTLFIMIIFAIIYSAIGIGMEILKINQLLSLMIFLGVFSLHCLLRSNLIHCSKEKVMEH